MLRRLDKLAPVALVLMLGYLTYTTVVQGHSGLTEQRRLPKITEEMLNPVFVEATDHASPVDRDPFEVGWASYLQYAGPRHATSQPATTQPATQPATRPAAPPATRPAEAPPPALPGRLSGVFLGQDLRIAVIGQRIYKVGSIIGGDDPRRCWRIEAIEPDHVIIRFGGVRRVLRITSDSSADGRGDRARGSTNRSARGLSEARR